jgi:hypothetical protein
MPPDYKYHPRKIVDKIEKKIKHLRATFLQFAQEKSMPGAWTDKMEIDFEFIEQMETDYAIRHKLLPGDMRYCNKLYNYYSVIHA